MKALSLLLVPLAVLFVSGCATGPGGPVYTDYGPGPDPRPGYYWNGTVYVQSENPYYHHHHDEYNREVTNVNEVDINRTNVNERTVNNTDVNNTRVNDRTVNNRTSNKRTINRTNVNQPNAEGRQTGVHKKTHKPNAENQGNQQGNQ